MCCMPNKTSKNRPSICNTNIRSSFSSAKENGWTYYNKLWQNIHSEAISISKKIRTQNGSRLRTDDRLESLLDSINSIIELPETHPALKKTGASLSQLATNYTLRWNGVVLIPHRETKKIPSYQYHHLNRYLKWLLFSASNRRSIQSQPNLGSPNRN